MPMEFDLWVVFFFSMLVLRQNMNILLQKALCLIAPWQVKSLPKLSIWHVLEAADDKV